MLKEVIKYTDFDGNNCEEEYSFNLSKPELGRLEVKYKDGLEAEMKRMADENDRSGMMNFLEDIIISSYGEKTPDGKGFIKDPEKTKAFRYSIAYSELYGKLFSSEDTLESFVKGILPPAEPNVPAPNLQVVK